MFAKELIGVIGFAGGFFIGALMISPKAETKAEPKDEIHLMKVRYNINCPLKFYNENEQLVVKSFSCTLDRKDVVKLDK